MGVLSHLQVMSSLPVTVEASVQDTPRKGPTCNINNGVVVKLPVVAGDLIKQYRCLWRLHVC